MLTCSIPSNEKEVMKFLGMTGFYRRFIPNYSNLAQPLTDLLGKRVKFVWTNEGRNAVQVLKGALIAKPVLRAPEFSTPFIL